MSVEDVLNTMQEHINKTYLPKILELPCEDQLFICQKQLEIYENTVGNRTDNILVASYLTAYGKFLKEYFERK